MMLFAFNLKGHSPQLIIAKHLLDEVIAQNFLEGKQPSLSHSNHCSDRLTQFNPRTIPWLSPCGCWVFQTMSQEKHLPTRDPHHHQCGAIIDWPQAPLSDPPGLRVLVVVLQSCPRYK